MSDEEKEPTLREVLNVILASNADFNTRASRLERHVLQLWQHVKGAAPPADEEDSIPPPQGGPLDQQVSGHSLELAALRSDVIQVKAIASSTQRETTKQSDFLGVGVKGIQFLMSPAGRKSVTAYWAAIAALIAAAAGAYNTLHHSPVASSHVEAKQ